MSPTSTSKAPHTGLISQGAYLLLNPAKLILSSVHKVLLVE